MALPPSTAPDRPKRRLAPGVSACVWGGVSGLLLLLFFSPPWLDFVAWTHVPEFALWAVSVRRAAVVLAQVAEPFAPIADSLHGILQFRFLVPLVGNVLHLPGSMVFALAPLGAWATLAVFIHRLQGLASAPVGGQARPLSAGEACAAAVVFGGGSWFFASTSWLGYYDCLVLLALLVVAYGRGLVPVIIASALAPWIDERFFLGFPLALMVRWSAQSVAGEPASVGRFARAIAWPAAVVAVQFIARFYLVGAMSSPSLDAYFKSNGIVALFLSDSTSAGAALTRLGYGLWEGLRVGWVVLVLGTAVLWRVRPAREAVLWGLAIVGTAALGVATANDLSRSMMLVAPAVLLAWRHARELELWRRWRVPYAFAALTLLLPAAQVVTDAVIPIRTVVAELWILRERDAVAHGQYHAGLSFLHGVGAPRDLPRAAEWLKRAAEREHPAAQLTLGSLHLNAAGPAHGAEAFKWMQRAARNDMADADYCLGTMYQRGLHVLPDGARAVDHFRKAAEKGHPLAQYNLAVLYFKGEGAPRDLVAAAAWMHLAKEHGDTEAAASLDLIEKQLSEADRAAVASRAAELRQALPRTGFLHRFVERSSR